MVRHFLKPPKGALGKRLDRLMIGMGWSVAEAGRQFGFTGHSMIVRLRLGERFFSTEYVLRMEAFERLYADQIEMGLQADLLRTKLREFKPGKNKGAQSCLRVMIRELEKKIASQNPTSRADLAEMGVVGPAPAAPPAGRTEEPARTVLREVHPRGVFTGDDPSARDRRPAYRGSGATSPDGAIPA